MTDKHAEARADLRAFIENLCADPDGFDALAAAMVTLRQAQVDLERQVRAFRDELVERRQFIDQIADALELPIGARPYDERLLEAVEALKAKPAWRHIDNEKPSPRVHVALCSDDRYENAPGVEENRVKAVGYRNECGGLEYWSIMGSRGADLRAFPWWAPLAPAPGEGE